MTNEEILKARLDCAEMDWPIEETEDLHFKTAREVLGLLARARAAGLKEGKVQVLTFISQHLDEDGAWLLEQYDGYA